MSREAGTPPFLGIYGITVAFGERLALDSVSFELEAGEIATLIGPNGSGKSTLLKAISGILPLAPKDGQVRLRGRDFLSLPPFERARQVAYIGEEIRAEFPLTAFEAVSLGRICQGGGGALGRVTTADEAAIREAMSRAGCWSLRDRDIGTLSGGERQLVAFSRALAQGARILLLDEAMSRMDLHHQARVGGLLRELAAQGYAIILVAHDLNLAAEWARTGILLALGRKITMGPIAEVVTEKNLATIYPGAKLSVGENPSTKSPKVFFSRA